MLWVVLLYHNQRLSVVEVPTVLMTSAAEERRKEEQDIGEHRIPTTPFPSRTVSSTIPSSTLLKSSQTPQQPAEHDAGRLICWTTETGNYAPPTTPDCPLHARKWPAGTPWWQGWTGTASCPRPSSRILGIWADYLTSSPNKCYHHQSHQNPSPS